MPLLWYIFFILSIFIYEKVKCTRWDAFQCSNLTENVGPIFLQFWNFFHSLQISYKCWMINTKFFSQFHFFKIITQKSLQMVNFKMKWKLFSKSKLLFLNLKKYLWQTNPVHKLHQSASLFLLLSFLNLKKNIKCHIYILKQENLIK